MKKLNLNELEVESFATMESGRRMGTVVGHMPPYTIWTCPDVGCVPQTTNCPPPPVYTDNDDTCQQTCADGCHLSLYGDPAAFTCNPDCFSYYTDCHRCP